MRPTLAITLSALGLAVLVSLSWLWWLETADDGIEQHGYKADDRSVIDMRANVADSHGANVQETPLWLRIDESVGRSPPPYAPEWSKAGRALVEISDAASSPGLWQVGDRLLLPLPQLSETYNVEIEKIDEAVGSRALIGTIEHDDGRHRRCIVTLGSSSLFAYIDTPAGSFELVANHEYGWLLPSSSMNAGWDYSKRDYVLDEDLVALSGDSHAPIDQP